MKLKINLQNIINEHKAGVEDAKTALAEDRYDDNVATLELVHNPEFARRMGITFSPRTSEREQRNEEAASAPRPTNR